MAHSRSLRRLGFVSAGLGGLWTFDHFALEDSLTRNIRTLYTGAVITADYKLNFKEGATAAELEAIHGRTAKRILDTCKKNGGLYIKFGQGVASQNHVLPPQFNETFKVLYDAAPAVGPSQVRELFVEEFGKPPEEAFSTFDWSPIGSASIAQVHKATLKDGTPVAVKVQKPYIRTQMYWDLVCQRIVTHALEYFFEIPMTWSLDYMQKHMRLEVDFLTEAKNAERCKRDFQGEPGLREDVYVPKVFWEHTSSRVMTAEWIEGTPLSADSEIRANYDTSFIVGKIVDMFGFQIFKSGFLHSDPHPGNFLVRPNPTNPKRPQLVLLDHGLYIDESPSFRLTYSDFWRAIMLADLPTLRQICDSWGMGDIGMAASAALQRPFDPVKAKATGKSAWEKPTTEDIYAMQMKMKKKAREVLLDEKKFPRELIFVGRNMTIVRSVNKGFGSPVDRVTMTARWAIRSTTSHESLTRDVDPSHLSTTAYLSRYLSANLSAFQFESSLFILSAGFWATKVYQWWWRDVFGYGNVKGYEELLESGMRAAVKGQYGIVLDERSFDA